MPRKTKKPFVRKVVLRLPDLDHAKTSVLNGLSSPRSRRNYKLRHGAVHHLVLFRTKTCPESNGCSTLPSLPRIARISRGYDQPEACGRQEARLRGSGLGLAESGTCG
jgi:hypothetical protein